MHWGRTTCPDTPGIELVYREVFGGGYFNHEGGGVNYLCLPEEPQYAEFLSGVQNPGLSMSNNPISSSLHDHTPPCVRSLLHLETIIDSKNGLPGQLDNGVLWIPDVSSLQPQAQQHI